MSKIKQAIKNPSKILIKFFCLPIFKHLSDQTYLKIMFYLNTKETLNLSHPITFNQKLQWLKLFDRQSIYTEMVDKFEVRKIVSERLGKEFLIPLIGIYDNFEQMDFDNLPTQFVLKPNHTSGNVFVCKDKRSVNKDELRIMAQKWLDREYYWVHREWPYKNIKPKLVCEAYMKDAHSEVLTDYKIYCFNGLPQFIQVISERGPKGYYVNHFDFNWKEIDIDRVKYKRTEKELEKPAQLAQMREIAMKLCEGLKFVRIDLYVINGLVYFGEITFFPVSGYVDLSPKSNLELGNMLSLD